MVSLGLLFHWTVACSTCCLAFTGRYRRHDEHTSQRRWAISGENPMVANLEAVSLGGVRHADVLKGINVLFPPEQMGERDAISRKDGYWPFVQKGKDVPTELTYGEFDISFFAQLLDRARTYYEGPGDPTTWNDKVFVDIGSGTGRLVFAAAGLHPGWKQCRGIEILQGIHDDAMNKLSQCRFQIPVEAVNEDDDDQQSGEGNCANLNDDVVNDPIEDFEFQYFIQDNSSGDEDWKLPLAPVDFVCGSTDDPYIYIGDADCIFIFSTCMRSVMDNLAKSIGRQCRPGTIVITIDYLLLSEGFSEPVEDDARIPSGPFQFQLLETLQGWCSLTGGNNCAAYIQKVIQSQWSSGQMPLLPKELTLSQKAYKAVKFAEDAHDPARFLREVYNNMVFVGIPSRFWPKSFRPE